MVVVLVVTFLVLFAGNGILASSEEALYRTYTAHVSGDLSVAATSENTFTIFGSDALLVGEYLVPPTIVRFEQLREAVDALERVRAAAGVVSSVARVEIGRRRSDQTLFGVDFERYRALFPELEIVAGDVPPSGERGILIQAGWAGTGEDTAHLIGRRALLAVAHDITFTLREVPVTGVFRYPVEDDLLATVALVDPDTARALNGYIYGAGGSAEIAGPDQDLFESEVDDLFGETEAWDADPDPGDPAEGTDILADLDAFFSETRDEAIAARRTVAGAWNFLLLSLYDREDAGAVTRELERLGFDEERGYLLRDWRRTVGGTAQLVWYLQLMFNAGLLFVAFGAAIITTNALVLSVLERTAEIGTMRALGATRARVAAMITAETVVVVAGAAAVGLVLGGAALGVLNREAVVLENPYIEILFGGEPIRGIASPRLVLGHLGLALALALIAVVYPLKRALGISPVRAMAA